MALHNHWLWKGYICLERYLLQQLVVMNEFPNPLT